ncbi:MAG: FliA/WhiG family RNA polymerase sigma factor [Clostridiales bacterium]|nr:FliA/WhiG family RNA polymerase sigma factor [Eubacterium sp.]MDD5995002.1 FliA/WhiG family RNA polymerase sigma factor [Clostridiales bacterium]MDD7349071.1 FliA/WhiG family RNA polymerase sigma factor [Clostridiales bacterium]MDY3774279.1 FliA/WhiG family RNA polymerase sigma factor [Eubacterium sp.]
MKEEQKQKLWDEYKKNKSPDIREKLILEYANLVNLVAGRMGMYLGYTVEYDDLVGYGIFGLIDAIDKFDLTKNVKFETYASLRIRGSILDQIRKMDWVPRTLRQRQKQIDTATAKIEADAGRPATDAEIAKELNIPEEEYTGWKSEIQLSNMLSLDDYLEQSGDSQIEPGGSQRFEQPEKAVEKEELKQMLVEAMKTLTEKECSVITLYYYEDLTLKEISRILEVSESRVSQLHSKALQKMKNKLGDSVELLSLF